jgi:hypothetical protein
MEIPSTQLQYYHHHHHHHRGRRRHWQNNPFSAIAFLRSTRWAGHVAQNGRRGIHVGYWWESQKERDHYEDQDVGGWIILK